MVAGGVAHVLSLAGMAARRSHETKDGAFVECHKQGSSKRYYGANHFRLTCYLLNFHVLHSANFRNMSILSFFDSRSLKIINLFSWKLYFQRQ